MSQEARARVAIVDDYPQVGETIAAYLRRMSIEPILYTDPLDFLGDAQEKSFDILITDIRMPQLDGLALLKKMGELAPRTEVIVMSAHADKHDAIEALKNGAFDFFEKPVSEVDLVAAIQRTLAYKRVVSERDELSEKLSLVTKQDAEKWGVNAFVGKGPATKEIIKKIRLVQKSRNTNVLILGESGTGKELVARAIHFGSDRANGPFVAVNCSAIPSDLAESILFGHIKGSFTGATADRKGQFELADGGTLFLDEIGDMTPLVQTKLLRVLEDGIVIPVGKASGKKIDVRVVSATNADIEGKIASGKFRSDLYHRLASYEMKLPPLRERSDDIPLLIQHFVRMLSGEMAIAEPEIDKSFTQALSKHAFHGNIRELRNIVERALIDADGSGLRCEHLCLPTNEAVLQTSSVKTQHTVLDSDKMGDIPLNLKEAEKYLVQRALDQVRGNVAEASRLLGISRAKIYRITG